jgi:shikimate kinase
LCAALASNVPSVIAVAGGAVVDPESRRRLGSAGVVVWLDVSPKALAARVGAEGGRPLIASDPAGNLRRLDARRRSVYRELADVVVQAGSGSPAEIAEDVVRAARARLDSPTAVWSS